jgi:hypothetical protein
VWRKGKINFTMLLNSKSKGDSKRSREQEFSTTPGSTTQDLEMASGI